jgi:hypothetical protein
MLNYFILSTTLNTSILDERRIHGQNVDSNDQKANEENLNILTNKQQPERKHGRKPENPLITSLVSD